MIELPSAPTEWVLGIVPLIGCASTCTRRSWSSCHKTAECGSCVGKTEVSRTSIKWPPVRGRFRAGPDNLTGRASGVERVDEQDLAGLSGGDGHPSLIADPYAVAGVQHQLPDRHRAID